MIKARAFSLLLLLTLLMAGCGRYVRPQPPENFAPDKVSDLKVLPSVEGVKISWEAPEDDASGDKLEELEGYRIYRQHISRVAEEQTKELELLTTIPDNHIEELRKLREEAVKQGVPVRQVTIPAEKTQFTYTDTTAEPGKTYVYRVVPINQGGVEGVIESLIQVHFLGERSTTVLIPFKGR